MNGEGSSPFIGGAPPPPQPKDGLVIPANYANNIYMDKIIVINYPKYHKQ